MALLQISEPGQSPVPHQFKRVAGIDLGTTNSLVATVESGEAVVIRDEHGEAMLPSVVHFAADGHIDVGYEARAMAVYDSKNTLSSFKRWLGRDGAELDLSATFDVSNAEGVVSVATAAGDINAIQASGIVLERLARRAESRLGGALEGVVITVPAYFDDSQRQSTRDAARLAGLNVLRLINEPTAAAVAYGLDKADDRMIAVYDLGGGTFDISILQLSEGVFEVVATGGDSALGGDDFDVEIAHWIAQQAGIDERELSAEGVRLLQKIAVDTKQQLSDVESCAIEFGEGEQQWRGELTRETFNQLILPWIEKTLVACKQCMADADLERGEIADVVMVGGSTRVPMVREKVADYFGQPVRIDVDPDQVVAIGAAIQADILSGNKRQNDLLLLDVTPLSLGLEMYGGLVEKIIPRNTPIPVVMAQEFTTAKDGQTALSLHVMQGERERVEDCRSLARFQLTGIPPMVAGAAKIEVSFSVNADGILEVSAHEKETGVSAAVTVEPSNGLDESQITDILRSSFQFAEADKESRQWIEQQVDARALLDSVQAALTQDRLLLNDTEYATVSSECSALEQALEGKDIDELRTQTSRLAKATEVFAARRMDKSIKQALQGKTLDDVRDRI